MKWNNELITLVEDCLWDLVETTKMSGTTVQDAIEALHEKREQIKVNGADTSCNKALNLADVSNNEASESSSEGVAACSCKKPHIRFDCYNNVFCAKCNKYIAR